MDMADNTKISTVCFTGHRYIDKKSAFKIPTLLKKHLRRYIEGGAYRFRVGGAMGFDTVAALCVLELSSEYPHLELELVIPCPEQTRGWSDECRRVYNYIMKRATKVECVSDRYTSHCMYDRNRRLVDESQACIAFLQRNEGGTAYTYAYALKQGIEVINLYDEIR